MYWYCEQLGFDAGLRQARLALLGLGDADMRVVPLLHRQVINPKREVLVNAFLAIVLQHKEPQSVLAGGYHSEPLKKILDEYLQTLGRDFTDANYFEARLRIGVVHAWARLGLGAYIAAMRVMQQLLLDEVPPRAHKANMLRSFIIKILALDMSLACDAFHGVQTLGLEHFIESLQISGRQMRHALEYDALTGVLSRAQILTILEHTVADSRDAAHPCCVIMADLDHFKQVNDEHGHGVGDKVLRDVAARIGAALRHEDRVGRYGGEEFVIVLGGTALAEARDIAERVRERVASDPIVVDGRAVAMTISQGLAELRADEVPTALLERADKAMYDAKQAGRNCVQVDVAPALADPLANPDGASVTVQSEHHENNTNQ
ncbi:MAG: diguanylate cyclase [Gammaproteobacteria bacterium]|nr:diguanylate cyclase [Gammaproteobacteria bacterium]